MTLVRKDERRRGLRGRVVLGAFGVVARSRLAGWVAKRMAGVR